MVRTGQFLSTPLATLATPTPLTVTAWGLAPGKVNRSGLCTGYIITRLD